MRKIILIVIFFSSFKTGICQQLKVPFPPEYVNKLYFLTLGRDSIVSLKHTTVKSNSRKDNSNFLVYFYFESDIQPTILAGEKGQNFVFKFSTPGSEPSLRFTLYKVTTYNKYKAATLRQQTKDGISNKGPDIINCLFKNLGNDIYEVVPENALEEGEYFFIDLSSNIKYNGQEYDIFYFKI